MVAAVERCTRRPNPVPDHSSALRGRASPRPVQDGRAILLAPRSAAVTVFRKRRYMRSVIFGSSSVISASRAYRPRHRSYIALGTPYCRALAPKSVPRGRSRSPKRIDIDQPSINRAHPVERHGQRGSHHLMPLEILRRRFEIRRNLDLGDLRARVAMADGQGRPEKQLASAVQRNGKETAHRTLQEMLVNHISRLGALGLSAAVVNVLDGEIALVLALEPSKLCAAIGAQEPNMRLNNRCFSDAGGQTLVADQEIPGVCVDYTRHSREMQATSIRSPHQREISLSWRERRSSAGYSWLFRYLSRCAPSSATQDAAAAPRWNTIIK